MLFLSAGEKSGDLLGASILKALYAKDPSFQIAAVAGPLMREFPVTVVESMESLQVMGIADILSHAPSLIRIFYKMKKWILKNKPETVIFIDYNGMHLLLAEGLRRDGYRGKIAQVVCPAIWAWGKRKIPTLENCIDHVFCLFPFEADLLHNAHYVGHPLVEMIPPPTEKKEKLLTLFPGSRKGEIKRNLPLQLAAAKKFIASHPDFHMAVSGIDFPPSENYAMMRKSSLAIAKSGTVNLELALHEVKTVVTYQMNKLDYFLGKHVFRIRLPHFCIVNILLNKRLFPEHYGIHLSLDAISQDLETVGAVTPEIRSILGTKKSAEEIVEILFASRL